MPVNTKSGWIPQPDDPKDWIYVPPAGQHVKSSEDLRGTHHMQREVFDQGGLGSCTAQAIASALIYGKNSQFMGPRGAQWDPSRLFIYYHERIMKATTGDIIPPDRLSKFLSSNDATVTTASGKPVSRQAIEEQLKLDEGATERNGIKSITKYGVCSETTWPYNDEASDSQYWKPPPNALKQGSEWLKSYLAKMTYWRIKDIADGAGAALIAHMEAAISEGFPVVFAFRGSNKNAPLEGPFTGGRKRTLKEQGLTDDGVYAGWVQNGDEYWGHCVLAVGYDRQKQRFLVLNSWGKDWGLNGYFYMPYRWFKEDDAYFVDNEGRRTIRVDDLWVVKCVMEEKGTLGTDVGWKDSRP